MAHRPLYRVLGETSLELKCLTLFGAFLLLVVTASFLTYWYVTERVVTKQNPITGRMLAHQTMVVTHWEGSESDNEYVDVVRRLREDFTHFTPQSGKEGNKKESEDYYDEFITCDPSAASKARRRQPLDAYEQGLLEQFKKSAQEAPSAPNEAGRIMPERFNNLYKGLRADAMYQYYKPIYVKQSCLGVCHSPSSPGIPSFEPAGNPVGPGGPGGSRWAPGDLMGLVCITIPNQQVQAEVSMYWNTLLAVAIFTLFLAMVAFYFTIRRLIIRPLRHLREVSDAISRGNIAQRANLHTGDEFESLGVAFNRMLRHLVTVQDELRQVNADLDGKVDELAQANMKLYEMNRIKSDFLATISHELRTPLNSILGFSDVLGSINSLDDKQKRYVGNIQTSGKRLLEMINNILDIAKIESGKMETRLTEFRVEQVIAAQCDMARPLSEKKNIDLTIEIQPDLPPIIQDEGRVQQILQNLLSNAIKFTPEGGRVRVTAHRNDCDELILRVIDTGVGIAEEDQQVIFEKFRQGRTALPGGDAMTREYSGTGLGLSIVKELCKLLEGGVTVESELGMGSTFTVRLPCKLQRQPRLESPLADGLDRLGKPRLDSPAA